MNTRTSPPWRKYFRALREGWMAFGKAIGMIVGSVLLTVFWALVFGAYALLIKWWYIVKAKSPKPKSTWIDIDQNNQDYRYQF